MLVAVVVQINILYSIISINICVFLIKLILTSLTSYIKIVEVYGHLFFFTIVKTRLMPGRKNIVRGCVLYLMGTVYIVKLSVIA